MATESFNQLENELLAWIDQHTQCAQLTAQLAKAKLERRDYMRTGFFVYFTTDPTCEPIPAEVKPVCPQINSRELMDGAGCNLFTRDGRLHYLEIYTRGGFIPEQLQEFHLDFAD